MAPSTGGTPWAATARQPTRRCGQPGGDPDAGDLLWSVTKSILPFLSRTGSGWVTVYADYNTGKTEDQLDVRATATKYIWQAFNSPKPASINSFTDVSTNADYAEAIAWAKEKGITTGTVTPNKVCNRGHIVTFLMRAYKK